MAYSAVVRPDPWNPDVRDIGGLTSFRQPVGMRVTRHSFKGFDERRVGCGAAETRRSKPTAVKVARAVGHAVGSSEPEFVKAHRA